MTVKKNPMIQGNFYTGNKQKNINGINFNNQYSNRLITVIKYMYTQIFF